MMLPLDCVETRGDAPRDATRTAATLDALKASGVEGVMVDCWWGIVEGAAPRRYAWEGYRRLLEMCRARALRVDVVLAFHACGSNVGDGACEIALPHWARGVEARENMYADRRGSVTEECLSLWGDETRDARRGDRTPLECYRDFMRAFRDAFERFMRVDAGEDGPTITQVIIGLGPCGELRYPSYRASSGWRFPGVGEFQCYDERARASLAYEAAAFGKPEWGRHPPPNGPDYACDPEGRPIPPLRETSASDDEPEAKRRHAMPHVESDSSLTSASFSLAPECATRNFFATDGTGSWDTPHGKFFLSWYHRELIAHGERVLEHAAREFRGVDATLGIKCAGVHWWHDHPSRAAECAAGYYNARPSSRSTADVLCGCEPAGYSSVIDLCARFNVELTFTCAEMRDVEHDDAYMCSPEGLFEEVVRCAAERGVRVNTENALARFDADAYAQILRAYERYGAAPTAATTASEDATANEENGSLRSVSSDETTAPCSRASFESNRGVRERVLGAFTYLRACDALFEPANFTRFSNFVRRMSEL